MKLYNTLTKSVEEFEPINPPHVGLYACGPTVYDFAHLGHLRKYTMDDVLIRVLRHAGYDVEFVQNVTDVGHLASDSDTGEDKLEKGAKKYGESAWDIAKKFEDYFYYSMDLMGNLRPDVSCRATDHIQEQLEMVKTLEEKGFTYVIEGDGVYFDTSKLEDYGQMANLNPEMIKEGARVAQVEGKRNPTDFALWKFERPGENRAMVWPSPWAERSFPGWHIECSAMSVKYLGEQFDIHTGGIDHIPVHHVNEIAQSETATGKKPFVKYWIHHNFLRVEGEKMSKSLENFFTIDDVVKRSYSPMALRLLFLTSHYRSELNFTWDNLAGAQKSYQKLVSLIVQHSNTEEGDQAERGQVGKEWSEKFYAALENDLNTPQAVAILWEMLGSELSDVDKVGLVKEFCQVLGLKVSDLSIDEMQETQIKLEDLPEEVQRLLSKRLEARKEKNWSLADELRNQINDLGYHVKDESDGQQSVQYNTD